MSAAEPDHFEWRIETARPVLSYTARLQDQGALGMDKFFAELKRRNLYRVGAGYVVVAWALAQVVDLLSQIFQLPSWIAQPAILILAAGLPVTLAIVWIVESKPKEAISAAVHSKNTAVDWALFSAVAVLIALTGYQQIVRSSAGPGPLSAPAARDEAVNPANGLSIAVLPFANLSGDAGQEFFSDGITEEITSTLAKVPDLRVVGRTSAFQFKGKSEDLRFIGKSLAATHLIEGSVRKAGQRIRITVQLIKADDGTHVWAEDYDRQLSDIFAIQEDIARTIAASLRIPLGLKPGESLTTSRTADQPSYEDYLRARALVRKRDATSIANAIKILEQALAHDPSYAPAWGLLSYAYSISPLAELSQPNGKIEEMRAMIDAASAKADAPAERALALDPKNPDVYYALWIKEARLGHNVASIEMLDKLLALDPGNPDALFAKALGLAEMGYLKDAVPLGQKVIALEPFVPAFALGYARMLFANGQTEDAIATNSRAPIGITRNVAEYYAAQGRFREAADLLQSFVQASDPLPNVLDSASKLLRSIPAKTKSPQSLPRLSVLGWVYLYVGAPERYMESYEDSVRLAYYTADTMSVWAPQYKSVRQTGRFKAYVRARGMIDYWRAKGWPDLCHLTTGNDFECN
jgi:TolB-like protein